MSGALARLGGLRGPPAVGPGQEWLHLSLRQGDLDLVINFNLAWGATRRPLQLADEGRVIVLLRRGDRWSGALHREADPTHGPAQVQIGPHRCTLQGDTLHLHVAGPISADLRLVAQLPPGLTHHLPLGAGGGIDWLVAARLRCLEGRLVVDGQTIELSGALAYHDHNWGPFVFGDDFSWEWGFGLPHDPDEGWAVVFSRLSDAARHRTRAQGLNLYDEGRLVAVFMDHELQFEAIGAHRQRAVFTLPGAAALALPPSALGVPAAYRLRAQRPGCALELVATASTVARIAAPDARRDEGLVLVYEIASDIHLTGTLRGRRLDWRGAGVTEAVRPHG